VEVLMARDYPLMIRLSDEERRALEDAAHREDIPKAQFARRAIKRELERLATEVQKDRKP
jgi:predicted transcriptional regulator